MSSIKARVDRIERKLEPVPPDFAIVPLCRTKAEHDAALAEVRERYPRSCLIDYQPVLCR